jgi:hypothetical protein
VAGDLTILFSTTAAWMAATNVVKFVFGGFCRLPALVKFAIVAGVTLILFVPEWRSGAAKLLRKVCGSLGAASKPLLEMLAPLFLQFGDAEDKAEKTQQHVESLLPPMKRFPALVHARRVCILNDGPIALRDLARRVQGNGYASKSKDFEGYLRRVMRASGQFVEVKAGVWKLRGDKGAAVASAA